MSDSDVVFFFSPLDELIQVIYQGSSRFVVISSVDDTHWKVRLGLSDSNGRWWEGRWGQKDMREAAKQGSCRIVALGDTLASAFAQGEMYIGNWSSKKGAEINFVLGTNTNHPAQMPLTELAPEDAASFATQVFADIAIQAQDRKSRLHPSPYESSTPMFQPAKRFVPRAAPTKAELEARAEVKALKEELARERSNHKRKAEDDGDRSPLKPEGSIQETSKLYSIAKGSRVIVPARGASLANPTKKARRIKTIEFGSDDD